MTVSKPESNEYAPFYAGYVAIASETEDVMAELANQPAALNELLGNLAEEKALHRYAEGKWSIKELIAHMSDAERIFGYRALRFARNDKTPLASFDENTYAVISKADNRSLENLLEEFRLLREANLVLFRTFGEEEHIRSGIASEAEMSVRALIYVMAGHVAHHVSIIHERYL